MATYRGQDGVLKIEGAAVAELKSFEFGTNTDAIDVTPKGSQWRKKKPGHVGWSGRATVMLYPADPAQASVRTTVLDASNGAITATLIFYPGGTSVGGIMSGEAVITAHRITSPEDSSVVTADIEFEGAGELADGDGS